MRSKLATSSYASLELQQPMEVETIATSKLVFGEEREEAKLAPHESKYCGTTTTCFSSTLF